MRAQADDVQASTWSNWYGNVSCHPRRVARPVDEAELQQLVCDASDEGLSVRAAGAGHSNVPLVSTDGLLVDMTAMRGLRGLDAAAGSATFGAGTSIADVGRELWRHGLSLRNQGDINGQTLAGAVATGTHGTGLELPSISGAVRGMRLVTAGGRVVDVDETWPSALRAARCSLGALGVATEVTVDVVEAFNLVLDGYVVSWPQLAVELPDLLVGHRSVAVYWCPHGTNPWLPGMDASRGEQVMIKTMDPREARDAPVGDKFRTQFCAPAHEVWPDPYEADFHEFEYMIPLDRTLSAMGEIRELMQRHYPQIGLPVEIRFVAADDGHLSPFSDRASGVISISGPMGEDNTALFRDCDRTLQSFSARTHWGKWHEFDVMRVQAAYPGFAAFDEVRRELDPGGTFLNPHLERILERPRA